MNYQVATTTRQMTDLRQHDEDQKRLSHWFHEHGKAVRGYLLGMVRSLHLAEELTQEVFCRAWQARERYREQGNTRAYLMRIADRLACDHARRPKSPVHLDDDGWKHYEPPDRAADPHHAAAESELIEQLAAAMNELSEPQRRVLLLRYYGQLGFTEIAAAIDCPLSTALSHCRRGLESLRRLLGENDI